MSEPAQTGPEQRPDVLAEIGALGDFPAAARVIQRLNESVRREDCKAIVVARTILQDPGLSSKVLRVVNSSFYRHGGEPVSTISRAVILMGFDAIRDLTAGILLVEQLVPKGRDGAFVRETFARSLRCGLVAQALSARVGYANSEEAYLLGLFANLGLLWLGAYYPEPFARAREMADAEDIPLDDAVMKVFGVRLSELSAAILERWQFPPSYAAYFRHPPAAEAGRAHDGAAKLAALVSLASEYTSTEGPTDVVLERFRTYFAVAPEQFLAAAESAEGAFRQQAPILGMALGHPPASTGTPAATHAASGRAVGPAPAPTPAAAPRPVHEPHAAEPASPLAIIAEITQAILAHENINDILSMVLEGIARAGRFDSVLLALLNPTRDRLVGRLGFGDGVDAFLRTLVVPLRPDAGALAEAMLTREPRVVPVGSPADLVPRGVSTGAVRLQSFVVCPLIVRQKAVGVVVAARAGDPTVADTDLPGVQLFCSQASLALDRAAG